MIRSAIAVLLFLTCLKGFSQDVQFETKFSEPFVVYQFLNSLSANVSDNVYKKVFNRSNFSFERGLFAELFSSFIKVSKRPRSDRKSL